MGLLTGYEQLINSMATMSEDLHKLTKIIYAQQKQIHALTSCVEQLQDLHLQILELRNK